MENQENFLHYIIKSKIIKKNNIQINIPTFNSYEITKNTIQGLYSQKNINFDILLIDNASEDYKKLTKDFLDINYVVLKENTGSSGAQRIGAELALKNGYDYIIFTDNDAILLSNDVLKRMFLKFDKDDRIGAVVPKNIERTYSQKGDFYIAAKAFHYLFVKSEVLKKIPLHNFYLFLFADDVALTLKISSISKILSCGDIYYYHYIFSPALFQNFYNYFYVRGLLFIIFKERCILLKYRIKYLLVVLYKIFQMILHSIIFLDPSYIKTIFLSFLGFLNIEEDFKHLIPKNKYVLKEYPPEQIGEGELSDFVDMSNHLKWLFLPKRCCIHSNYLGKNIYFKLEKRILK